MIGINSLVQLKRGPLTTGLVTGQYESDGDVTVWIKWDGGIVETRKVKELREVATFHTAEKKI